MHFNFEFPPSVVSRLYRTVIVVTTVATKFVYQSSTVQTTTFKRHSPISDLATNQCLSLMLLWLLSVTCLGSPICQSQCLNSYVCLPCHCLALLWSFPGSFDVAIASATLSTQTTRLKSHWIRVLVGLFPRKFMFA